MIELACLEAQRRKGAKEEQRGSEDHYDEKPRGSGHGVEEMRSEESGQSASEEQ